MLDMKVVCFFMTDTMVHGAGIQLQHVGPQKSYVAGAHGLSLLWAPTKSTAKIVTLGFLVRMVVVDFGLGCLGKKQCCSIYKVHSICRKG